MIILKDGSKWAFSSEFVNRQQIQIPPYDTKEGSERLHKGNIPETSIRDFVQKLILYSSDNDNEEYLGRPEKWSQRGWDCNFNPYREVLGDIAIKKTELNAFQAYEMPWGEVLVVYQEDDCYNTVTRIDVYPDKSNYEFAVSLKRLEE